MLNHKPKCGAHTAGGLWLPSAHLTTAWISCQTQDTGPGPKPEKVRTHPHPRYGSPQSPIELCLGEQKFSQSERPYTLIFCCCVWAEGEPPQSLAHFPLGLNSARSPGNGFLQRTHRPVHQFLLRNILGTSEAVPDSPLRPRAFSCRRFCWLFQDWTGQRDYIKASLGSTSLEHVVRWSTAYKSTLLPAPLLSVFLSLGLCGLCFSMSVSGHSPSPRPPFVCVCVLLNSILTTTRFRLLLSP